MRIHLVVQFKNVLDLLVDWHKPIYHILCHEMFGRAVNPLGAIKSDRRLVCRGEFLSNCWHGNVTGFSIVDTEGKLQLCDVKVRKLPGCTAVRDVLLLQMVAALKAIC